MKKIVLNLIIVLVLMSCNNTNTSNTSNNKTQNNKDTTVSETIKKDSVSIKKDTSFISVVNKTIDYIKNKRFNKIQMAETIRFSPKCFLSDENIKLSKNKINELINSDTTLVWGKYDGSGENIKMSFTDYYNKFIYDKDYKNISPVLNKITKRGNTANNIKEIYPNSFTAEFYIEGTEKYSNMDWTSLYLVFEKTNSEYYLIAIVHDSWSI